MIFDPGRLCWISILSLEDKEPDVFVNLADDEENAIPWEAQGGTVREPHLEICQVLSLKPVAWSPAGLSHPF